MKLIVVTLFLIALAQVIALNLLVLSLFLFVNEYRQTISLILVLLPQDFVFLMKKFSVFHRYTAYQPNFLILIHLYTYLVLHIYVVFHLFYELLHVLSYLHYFSQLLDLFLQKSQVFH